MELRLHGRSTSWLRAMYVASSAQDQLWDLCYLGHLHSHHPLSGLLHCQEKKDEVSQITLSPSHPQTLAVKALLGWIGTAYMGLSFAQIYERLQLVLKCLLDNIQIGGETWRKEQNSKSLFKQNLIRIDIQSQTRSLTIWNPGATGCRYQPISELWASGLCLIQTSWSSPSFCLEEWEARPRDWNSDPFPREVRVCPGASRPQGREGRRRVEPCFPVRM